MSTNPVEDAQAWKKGYDQAIDGKDVSSGMFSSAKTDAKVREGYAEGLKDRARLEAEKKILGNKK